MPGLSPYKRTLTAAQIQQIRARGTTVMLRIADGPVRVTLQSNQVGSADGVKYSATMNQGEEWLHAEEFDSVSIENLHGSSNAIEFLIGFGRFIKPVPDIVNVQVTSAESETVTTEADETNIDVGNAGKVELLPADANRIFAIITALSTNAEEIRIGDDNITATRGTPLAAGESLKWTSKAACYACSIATVDQAAAKTIFSVS